MKLNPIEEAVYNRDLDKVKMLISSGVDLNEKDPDGRTPLMAAAYANYFLIAETLINAGADVDAKDNDGYSALYMAAFNNHLGMVHRLIEAGARVDPFDPVYQDLKNMLLQNDCKAVLELLAFAEKL